MSAEFSNLRDQVIFDCQRATASSGGQPTIGLAAPANRQLATDNRQCSSPWPPRSPATVRLLCEVEPSRSIFSALELIGISRS